MFYIFSNRNIIGKYENLRKCLEYLDMSATDFIRSVHDKNLMTLDFDNCKKIVCLLIENRAIIKYITSDNINDIANNLDNELIPNSFMSFYSMDKRYCLCYDDVINAEETNKFYKNYLRS